MASLLIFLYLSFWLLQFILKVSILSNKSPGIRESWLAFYRLSFKKISILRKFSYAEVFWETPPSSSNFYFFIFRFFLNSLRAFFYSVVSPSFKGINLNVWWTSIESLICIWLFTLSKFSISFTVIYFVVPSFFIVKLIWLDFRFISDLNLACLI